MGRSQKAVISLSHLMEISFMTNHSVMQLHTQVINIIMEQHRICFDEKPHNIMQPGFINFFIDIIHYHYYRFPPKFGERKIAYCNVTIREASCADYTHQDELVVDFWPSLLRSQNSELYHKIQFEQHVVRNCSTDCTLNVTILENVLTVSTVRQFTWTRIKRMHWHVLSTNEGFQIRVAQFCPLPCMIRTCPVTVTFQPICPDCIYGKMPKGLNSRSLNRHLLVSESGSGYISWEEADAYCKTKRGYLPTLSTNSSIMLRKIAWNGTMEHGWHKLNPKFFAGLYKEHKVGIH